MSHFTVMVRLSELLLAKHKNNLSKALAEILAPYEESPERPSPFVSFVEDDECSIDESTGKKGYWRNHNAKWDWYLMGGRWSGLIPVKPGRGRLGEPGAFNNRPRRGGADAAKLDDIDFDAVAALERKEFDSFRSDYRALLSGKRFPHFEGPRETMLQLGLMRCGDNAEIILAPDEVQIGDTWGKDHGLTDSRANNIDVARNLTDEQLDAYRPVFNPLKTYAALDEQGWHAPGRMGWFGCSDDNPDSYLEFAKSFTERFIRTVGPFDLLVVVDCHI